MSTRAIDLPPRQSFLASLSVQTRVIGALILRELHTRYGRENIGYLWMIGEPMLLASVIGIMHAANGHSSNLVGDLRPVPFGVLGYITFILFRGIVNRADGGMEANAPLLYHRQVKPFDIVLARAFLEFCGAFLTMAILMTLLVVTGLADPPARPLLMFAGWMLLLWYSLGHSLIISAITYENRTVGRLVHPYSYFMIGLSAAFFSVGWIPHPFREVLTYVPLTSIFELTRYGWFRSANLDYFFGEYVVASCLILTAVGLILLHGLRNRMHLS